MRMIESSDRKPISTNIQRYCFVRLRKSSMARPKGRWRVVGWRAFARPPNGSPAAELRGCRPTRSGDLAMREQPHDDAKRDQADEAVLSEIPHHPHDVGDDATEERDA